MAVKVIGSFLLILSFWGFGFYKSYSEKQKRDFLWEILLGLNALKKKIQLGSGDIEFLISETLLNENIKLKDGELIAYSRCIDASNLLILNNLIKDLGMGNKENECERIDVYYSMLSEAYEEEKQTYKNSSKIWQTLGLGAGVTVVLLII